MTEAMTNVKLKELQVCLNAACRKAGPLTRAMQFMACAAALGELVEGDDAEALLKVDLPDGFFDGLTREARWHCILALVDGLGKRAAS